MDLLTVAGIDVRAVTRDPQAAGLSGRVEVIVGDPSRPGTVAAALEGVTAVLLNPRAVGAAAGELVTLAGRRGARRVVALSALNVDFDLDRQPSRLRGEYNKEAEAAAVESGLEWVALRSGSYAVNAIGTWAAQIRAGDVVHGAYPQASWAPLHERDLAAVAAQALLTDELLGTRPVLTGPRSLTQPEMIAAIGDAIGRPLRFQLAAPARAKQAMIAAGLPEALAGGFLAMQAESFGQHNLVSGEVERILGRPGLSFAQWAAEHAAAFT